MEGEKLSNKWPSNFGVDFTLSSHSAESRETVKKKISEPSFIFEAVEDYDTTEINALAFKRGHRFEYLPEGEITDDYFFVRCLNTDERGYVPKLYVKDVSTAHKDLARRLMSFKNVKSFDAVEEDGPPEKAQEPKAVREAKAAARGATGTRGAALKQQGARGMAREAQQAAQDSPDTDEEEHYSYANEINENIKADLNTDEEEYIDPQRDKQKQKTKQPPRGQRHDKPVQRVAPMRHEQPRQQQQQERQSFDNGVDTNSEDEY